jgi:hypothetical protein
MKTPTLGYEEDTVISKIEIAALQLEEGIVLFIDKNFLCALTLAGASEEILSRLLNSRCLSSAVEESVEIVKKLQQAIGISALHGFSEKNMYKSWNSARNSVKHHNENESETITLNLFDEAYWMISRALHNAKKLEIEIKNARDFENWIICNINT